MSTKHTPGPWSTIDLPEDECIAVLPEEEQLVKPEAEQLNAGQDLCHCFGPDKEANALLAAAAPELLDFALLVLRGIESGHIKAKPFLDMNALVGDSMPMRTIGEAARDVIAKATGEKA